MRALCARAAVTEPATWTFELGARRPGEVRREANAHPGAEDHEARARIPELGYLWSGE